MVSDSNGTTLSPRCSHLHDPLSGDDARHGEQCMVFGSSLDRMRFDPPGPDRQDHQADGTQQVRSHEGHRFSTAPAQMLLKRQHVEASFRQKGGLPYSR